MTNVINRVKGELTLENVLVAAIGTPGVKINRDAFLRKELIKYCPEHVIRNAVKDNPAKAGISKKVINKIAKGVISYETNKVSALSFVASVPSSLNAIAAVGAVPTDIILYFSHILRVLQELAYLYGFPEFYINEENIDS